MCPSSRILIGLATLFLASCRPAVPIASVDDDSDAAFEIFRRRILPILSADKPSSCTECHLSGVDLKAYIRPSQPETFASLVAGGLIDIDQPDESKLLKLIERRPERPSLVTDEIRKSEAEAFRTWIRAAVRSPELLAASDRTNPIGPELPPEVIRHARHDRVLASFLENVWTEIGRCAACHSPDRNGEQVERHGAQVSWIRLDDPQGTLDGLVDAALIDLERPTDSLLLAKPLLKVDHEGGQKMVVGDRTYKQFVRFIEDYAATRSGTYRSPDELPAPETEHSAVTEIWMKIENLPAEFDGMLLQVDLHAREGQGWSTERHATSDRPVFGAGRLWQHSLCLTAPRDSARSADVDRGFLAPGRYLAKLYLDRSGKLSADPSAELGTDELIGTIEFESDWPEGYSSMTVIRFDAP